LKGLDAQGIHVACFTKTRWDISVSPSFTGESDLKRAQKVENQ